MRDEAVAWLVRVQSDAATAEDWSALTDWLEGSDARLAAFEEAELIVADLTLRRPTLDDVFLTLTGHAAENATDEDSEELAA